MFFCFVVVYCSAIGAMKIVEVESEGRFVRLRNVSRAEQDVGGYYLQQSVRGQPVSCFLFPPRTFIQPGVSITVRHSLCTALHCTLTALSLHCTVWCKMSATVTACLFLPTVMLWMIRLEASAWCNNAAMLSVCLAQRLSVPMTQLNEWTIRFNYFFSALGSASLEKGAHFCKSRLWYIHITIITYT